MRPVIDAADDSKPFIGIPFFLLPRMDHIEKKTTKLSAAMGIGNEWASSEIENKNGRKTGE